MLLMMAFKERRRLFLDLFLIKYSSWNLAASAVSALAATSNWLLKSWNISLFNSSDCVRVWAALNLKLVHIWCGEWRRCTGTLTHTHTRLGFVHIESASTLSPSVIIVVIIICTVAAVIAAFAAAADVQNSIILFHTILSCFFHLSCSHSLVILRFNRNMISLPSTIAVAAAAASAAATGTDCCDGCCVVHIMNRRIYRTAHSRAQNMFNAFICELCTSWALAAAAAVVAFFFFFFSPFFALLFIRRVLTTSSAKCTKDFDELRAQRSLQ